MNLTEAQQIATNSTTQSVAVIADAGTGKTRVLIERLKKLILEDHIPLNRILAFTFTEKAANEITARLLMQKLIKIEDEALLQIGTIHGFCSRLLRKEASLIQLDPDFRIESEANTILECRALVHNFLQAKLENSDPLISRLLQQLGWQKLVNMAGRCLFDPRMFFCDAGGTIAGDCQAFLAEIQNLQKTWQQQKIGQASLSFYDLEALALKLLEQHPPILEQCRRRFLHILVDEFQDTNPLQERMIQLISQPTMNHLFIVGDPKQSIYGFRQADPSLFKKVADTIQSQGGLSLELKQSFRMAPILAGTINKIFMTLLNEEASPFPFQAMQTAVPENGGELHLVVQPKDKRPIDESRALEGRWIAHKIKAMSLAPEQLSSTALIFRSGGPMKFYRDALVAEGIPCHVTRSENLLDQPVVRDLMHILTYLAGNTNPITMAGILRSPFMALHEDVIDKYLQAKPQNFLSPFTQDLFMDPGQAKKLNCLIDWIKSWESQKKFLNPGDLLRLIVSDLIPEYDCPNLRTSEPPHVSTSAPPNIRTDFLSFLHLIQELEPQVVYHLPDLVRHFQDIRNSGDEVPAMAVKQAHGAVQLLTIHAAKGLEFERVFLPQLYAVPSHDKADFFLDPRAGLILKKESSEKIRGLKIHLEETGEFLKFANAEDIKIREESKRLLYVAMTRAKSELFLFLKQPATTKIKLRETKNWNEWLWELLPEERNKAIHLSVQESKSSPWSGLAHKLVENLDDEERISNNEYSISNIQENNIRTSERPHVSTSALPNVRGITKSTYTVSAIESFLRCEKEYQLRYEKGVDAVRAVDGRPSTEDGFQETSAHPLDAQTWGLIVHEIMQFINWHNPLEDETVIRQALTNQHIVADNHELFAALKKNLENLRNHPEIAALFASPQKVYRELPFLLDGEAFFLRGTLDYLAQNAGNCLIVDYKTDRIQNQNDLADRIRTYEIQIKCYAHAAQKILGLSQLKTALIFTDGPHLWVKDWNASELGALQTELHNIHTHILGKTSNPAAFTHTPNRSTCGRCPYFELNYCGVKTSAPLHIGPSANFLPQG